MKGILSTTRIHENCLCVAIYFDKTYSCKLVSISVKAVYENANPIQVMCNRVVYITREKSMWSDTISLINGDVPIKVIVEIHNAGKLLYVQSFSVKDGHSDTILYFLNTEVCWRRENDSTISVFHTNGNLLFLKGIYKDLWEYLELPVSSEQIEVHLVNKGYSQKKAKLAMLNLVKRGLIIEEKEKNIDYI